MNDSAEWLDHINSEEHRNMLLNRHKVQRDPGDESIRQREADEDNPLWTDPLEPED